LLASIMEASEEEHDLRRNFRRNAFVISLNE